MQDLQQNDQPLKSTEQEIQHEKIMDNAELGANSIESNHALQALEKACEMIDGATDKQYVFQREVMNLRSLVLSGKLEYAIVQKRLREIGTVNGLQEGHCISIIANTLSENFTTASENFTTAIKKETNAPRLTGIISAKALSQMQFREQSWVIPSLLPEGLTILAGRPKTGKSWLTLQLCIASAEATPFFNQLVVSPKKVLYAALEDTPRRIKGRLECFAMQGFSHNLDISCDLRSYPNGGLEQIKEWILNYENSGLVVIDTMARFRSSTQPGNPYEQDTIFLAEIQKVALEHKISIIVVHHTRKGVDNDPLSEVLGSTAITATADAIWVLKKERSKNKGSLYITGRDVEENQLNVNFNKILCQWEIDPHNNNGDEISPQRQAIIACLHEDNTELTPKEIALKTDLSHESVKHLVRRMASNGEIIVVQHGKYTLPVT